MKIHIYPVTCANCGHEFGVVEIGSHYSPGPGSADLDSKFRVIDRCPACDHPLDHPEVVWREDYPATPALG